jgi:hypothetical protein
VQWSHEEALEDQQVERTLEKVGAIGQCRVTG